jgi:hypothetical protein
MIPLNKLGHRCWWRRWRRQLFVSAWFGCGFDTHDLFKLAEWVERRGLAERDMRKQLKETKT